MGQHDEYADQLEPQTRPRPKNFVDRTFDFAYNFCNTPVTWFREKIVEPNRPPYPWYHMKLRRVPRVDECYQDDITCFYEADQQYQRDKAVDLEIINILRYRLDDCLREEFPDYEKCMPMRDTYDKAAENWFMKYGDLGAIHTVVDALMKQKHRLIWERRHGEVGTGMRLNEYAPPEDH